MKKRQISTFIIALLTLSNILMPQRLHAQEEEKAEMPFYQGTMVGVDVAGLVGKALGGAYASSEALVTVNLQNRFFPTLEAGYGTIDTTDDETDIYYKAAAPYMRIGLDYNEFVKLYGQKKIDDAVLYAKDLKDRYSVLWLAYMYC